jgi:hypothetical protein
MPFPTESFDSLVSTFPAGYIVDPAALCEIARVLRAPDPATGKVGGCLVVVGLVVSVDLPVWRMVMRFLFGAEGDAVLDQFTRLARAVGLRVEVLEQGTGRVRVPVVIAERQQ